MWMIEHGLNMKNCKDKMSSNMQLSEVGLDPVSARYHQFGQYRTVPCANQTAPLINRTAQLIVGYGKAFKSHIFGSATIVSTDEEVNRYVFQSDAKTFVPSYPRSIMELMGKSSILLINGSLQRKIHGLVGAFLKSSQHKSQITVYMEKYIEEAMDSWKNGQLIHIQEIAFQVLVKSLINLDPGEDMQFLKKQFQEFNAGLMSLPIKLPGTRLYRSLQARYTLEENMELHRQKARLGEQLDWNDYMSLSFTQNVITETLRMGNVIIGAMRKAMKRMEIKGSVHLDGNNYADPYKFNPWRWQHSIWKECTKSFIPPSLHILCLWRWVAEDDSIINFPTVRMKKRMPMPEAGRKKARVDRSESSNPVHQFLSSSLAPSVGTKLKA
ncbi:Cytochrome P450 90D2 [Acorus calamus]|uniref:Cytochrome P450 90D2 n=1 Tax=Acorus calamus TaxID=4465 RepID=A0AAV9CMM3_ACOCL|nr:Cytochrome P450 90D2 [Acorus calamus]